MSDKIMIHPNGTHRVEIGPAQYFSGHVRITFLQEAPEPARVRIVSVTFEKGARTAWHTHPLGQTLIVTDGEGWVQEWGRSKRVMRKGDVVWIPPHVKHWHGATTSTDVTHIAVQEALEGKAVEWLEPVTDEQYNAGPEL